MALWMLVQAAGSGPAMVAGLERFDLGQVAAPSSGCGTGGADGEVVVCGSRGTRRLEALPEVADKPIRARIGVGAGTLTLHAIQSNLPGAKGSGAALTLKLPF